MKTPTKILLTLAAALTIAFASKASAGLITNGGFETGDFSGWTLGGQSGSAFVSLGNGNTGNFGAAFGAVGAPTLMSQNISTTAGATYDLSFFMLATNGGKENPAGGLFGALGSSGVSFQVFWGGTLIFDTNGGPSSYQQFGVNSLLATGASTTLTFSIQNDPSFFLLDDINLNQVSGPSVPDNISTLWPALPLIGMVGYSQLRRTPVRVALS